MNAQPSPHPTDQTLYAYGLGKLDDAAAGSVHRHLEACPDCRRRVAELSSDSFLGRLRDAKARPDSARPRRLRHRRPLDARRARRMPGTAPGRAPCRRGWPTTPTTRSSASWAAAAWASSTWRRTRSWAGWRCSRSSAATSSADRGVLDRFLREIRSAARLQHPNIVAAYSALRLGESLVFAMEYVEGLDLSQLVKARGPLPVANACNYMHQAALGCSTRTSTAWSTATSSRQPDARSGQGQP